MGDLQKGKSNNNFSFKKFEDLNIENEAYPNSLFNGIVIKNCSCHYIDINHSDVEAIKIYDNSKFVDCDFSNTDIHSNYFIGTIFIAVDFSESSIVDCSFEMCKFKNCKFDNSNMRESSFLSCIFDNCSLIHGSYLLNKFKDCTFYDMTFKNVFYYTIMLSCKFIDITFEAYLLGYTYGLTTENLLQLNYTYMGKNTTEKYETICSNINQIYLDRHMYINSGILFLMDENVSKNIAIKECYLYIGRYINNDYLIKSEQLMFLFHITELMFESKILPPIMLLQIIKIIDQIKSLQENDSQKKINDNLLVIQSNLLIRYYNFIDYISKKISYTNNIPNKLCIYIKYEKKPTLELVKLINAIIGTETAKQIDTKQGSFLEWIEGNPAIVTALSLLFEFLAVTVPISWDIIKEKSIHKSENEKANISITINNNISNSNIRKKELDFITNSTSGIINTVFEKKITNTIEVIINNNILDDSELCGYNTKNVKEMQITQNRT